MIRNTEVLSPSQEAIKRQAYLIANVQLRPTQSADAAESDDNDDEFPSHAPPSRQDACTKKVKTEYLSLREAASSQPKTYQSSPDSNGTVQTDSDASTPRKIRKKSNKNGVNTESVVVPTFLPPQKYPCKARMILMLQLK